MWTFGTNLGPHVHPSVTNGQLLVTASVANIILSQWVDFYLTTLFFLNQQNLINKKSQLPESQRNNFITTFRIYLFQAWIKMEYTEISAYVNLNIFSALPPREGGTRVWFPGAPLPSPYLNLFSNWTLFFIAPHLFCLVLLPRKMSPFFYICNN